MPDSTQAHKRAPAMTQQERRDMIIAAALPLLAERGYAVTTAAIARAAGIGEATIFRAFADKDELIRACLAQAMDPRGMLDELHAIPTSQPLPARLVAAADAIAAHTARVGTTMRAVMASGNHQGHDPRDLRGAQGMVDRRREQMEALASAVTDLLQPDQGALRLPADVLAPTFVMQAMARTRVFGLSGPGGASPGAGSEALVDVFLHGGLK